MKLSGDQLALIGAHSKTVQWDGQMRIIDKGSDALTTFRARRDGKPATTRFAATSANHFGVLYTAARLDTCIVETIIRNAYDWFPEARREIDKDEIDKRIVADLVFTRPVKTLRLTPLLATQLSLPKDVHGGKRQRDSRRFSTALYRQSDIEAIAFQSTWIGFECLAVYDRALDGLAVAAELPLNQHPDLGHALLSLNMRVKCPPPRAVPI